MHCLVFEGRSAEEGRRRQRAATLRFAKVRVGGAREQTLTIDPMGGSREAQCQHRLVGCRCSLETRKTNELSNDMIGVYVMKDFLAQPLIKPCLGRRPRALHTTGYYTTETTRKKRRKRS